MLKQDMKSQQITIGKNHSDVIKILKIRPRFWRLLWLPWWYNMNILYLNHNIRKALTENPPGPFCLQHARLLSGCYCDRKYIDVMLEHMRADIESGEEKMWIQAYLDVGLTLCDLGYSSEGISYIEKAVDLEKLPDRRNQYILQLCYRLRDEARYEKIIELAKTLVNDDPRNPVAKMVLVKAYIDAGRFNKEHIDIRKLVTEYPNAFGFLLGVLYFSSKDFKAASDAFDKYEVNRRIGFWLIEYDYKKAAAYYYSSQQDKCNRQAMKIRRRMKWDGFYRLDAIEKAGIERIPAIDEIIQSDEVDNVFLNKEKISHYFKTICHIMRLWIEHHWYIIILFLLVMLFLLIKLARYLL